MADEGTVQVLQNLNDCSTGMVAFSIAMKSIFNENSIAVTDQTRGFIEVRNNTRRNAAIYTHQILPLSENIVQKISTFTDYYEYLELEDWKDTLDDQIEELDQATADCNLMVQMHETIITSLNEDKGKVKKEALQIKLTAEKFERNAKISKFGAFSATAGAAFFTAVAMTVATGGFATAVAAVGYAAAAGNVADGVAADKNADIAKKNIDLAEVSILALGNFISGLRGLSAFFTATKSSLEKMRTHGDTASRNKKVGFFNMMKGVAKEMDDKCKQFLCVAQLLRSELGSLPYETSDKNYVDEWLAKELVEYKRTFKRDAMAFLSRTGWTTKHKQITE